MCLLRGSRARIFQVVDTLNRGEFDLVTMARCFPAGSGYDACVCVRAAGYSRMPIIAATAHTAIDDIFMQQASGFDLHLGKPFGMAELGVAVTAARAVMYLRRWTGCRGEWLLTVFLFADRR